MLMHGLYARSLRTSELDMDTAGRAAISARAAYTRTKMKHRNIDRKFRDDVRCPKSIQ